MALALAAAYYAAFYAATSAKCALPSGVFGLFNPERWAGISYTIFFPGLDFNQSYFTVNSALSGVYPSGIIIYPLLALQSRHMHPGGSTCPYAPWSTCAWASDAKTAIIRQSTTNTGFIVVILQ